MLQTLLAVTAAYILGSLVGAYYVVRFRAGHDVRATGSGNAGARNVLRSGDRVSAALTFGWDVLKGAVAVWLAQRIAPTDVAAGLAFVAAVVGHIWPAHLQFHGGKGVATAIGCMLAIGPRALVGSWTLVTSAGIAWGLVILAHQPAMDRRRRAVSGPPAQENAS